MESENNVTNTLTLSVLWKVFAKRFLILLIVGVLCFAGLSLYSNLTFDPEYQSVGEAYILRDAKGDQYDQNVNYQASLLIVKDCTYILQSRTVLDEVRIYLKETYGYKYSIDQLKGAVSISTPDEEGTRVLVITAKAESPIRAKRIVDAIGTIGTKILTGQILKDDQIRFYQEGYVPTGPCNLPSPMIMVLISVAVVAVLYLIFVLIFLSNEHIGTSEEIERRLHVAMLGEIPDAAKTQRRRGPLRYLRKYGKYGKYGQYSYMYGYGYGEKKKKSKKQDKGGESDK